MRGERRPLADAPFLSVGTNRHVGVQGNNGNRRRMYQTAFDPAAAIASPVDINQQPPAAVPAYVADELTAEAFMSTITIYLARLMGLSFVLLAACILTRGNALIMATVADGPVHARLCEFQSRSGTRNHTWAQCLVRRYLTSDSHLGRMVDLRERSGALAGNP